MPQNAGLVLGTLAIRARETIQPVSSGQNVAAVLHEMAILNKDIPLNFADCAVAFDVLSMPKTEDDMHVTGPHRRACRILAELSGCPVGGDSQRMIRVLRRFADTYKDSSNPLFYVMADEAVRECHELESAL
jgi:hypothetical protein